MQDFHLTSIHVLQFASLINPRHVSPPAKSWHSHINPIQVQSYPWGPNNCISPPPRCWYLRLKPNQLTSQLHPGIETCISHPHRCYHTSSRSRDSCVTSIQVPSHIDQSNKNCIPPRSWSCLPASQSWYSCLTSIQVSSHLHPCIENCNKAPLKYLVTRIMVSRYASHLHSGDMHHPSI